MIVSPRANLPHRFAALRTALHTALPDGLSIRTGSLRDYHILAHHHYRAGLPFAATAVFVLQGAAPSVPARFRALHQRDTQPDTNPHHVIGVLVRALPRLNCALRDLATADRYRIHDPSDRAFILNREVRTISRVVIHPAWRGLSLAVALVRHALAHPESAYTEAITAMGRLCPFFDHAGMTRYERPALAPHARLLDVLRELDIPTPHLASRALFLARFSLLTPHHQDWLTLELHRFNAHAFRLARRARAALTFDSALAGARDSLLSHPIYYLSRH